MLLAFDFKLFFGIITISKSKGVFMVKKFAFNSFYIIFGAFSLWILLAAFANGDLGFFGKGVVFAAWALVLAAAVFMVNKAENISDKNFRRMVFRGFIVYFLLLWIFGLLTMCHPVSDLEVLVKAADDFLENGHILDYSYYFTICKNTLGNALFIYIMYIPLHLMGINIRSDFAEGYGIGVNCLMIVLAVFFAYKIFCRIVEDKRFNLLFLMTAFTYIPFYLWAHRYYSDTLSLPFAFGGALLYLKARETADTKSKIAFSLLCGCTLWAGYFLRGSVAIMLPAVVIYAVFADGNAILKTALPAVAAFVLCLGAFSLYINNCSFIDYSQKDINDYPITMWLMYGAHGDGNYNDDDVNYMSSLPDYQTRKQAAGEKLKEYYSQYNISTFIQFLNKKYQITYGNGLFDAENYLNNARNGNFTHYFLIPGMPLFKPFRYIAGGIHLVYMFLTAISAFFSFKNKKWDRAMLMQIYMIGNIIFFSFWETKARYAFGITPVLLILSVYSVYNIYNLSKKYILNKKKATVHSS